jgi:pimeloyl-ACP methyl ester carboxylesterase/DNA-binding CsgD family transcriptional regulator
MKHINFHDNLLASVAGKHINKLQGVLSKLWLEKANLDSLSLSSIVEFPYAAGVLGKTGCLQAFNVDMVNLLTKINTEQKDPHLLQPYSVWCDKLEQYYEFKTNVNIDNKHHSNPIPNELIVYLSAQQLIDLLNDTNSLNRLTMGEAATLILITGGFSIEEVAEKHGVSYETRRKQLKEIRQKLDCADLAKLIQKVQQCVNEELFAILFDNLRQMQEMNVDRIDWKIMSKHYKDSIRIIQRANKHISQFTVFDIGPKDGHPVLVFTQIFHHTVPLAHKVNVCYQQNIRILALARPGYCGTSDVKVDTAEARAIYLQAVDIFLQEMGFSTISVLALQLGSVWAAEFLQLTTHKIDKAVFASPYIPDVHPSTVNAINKNVGSKLKGMVKQIENKLIKETGLKQQNLRALLRLMSYIVRTPDSFMNHSRKMYQHCPIDSILFDQMEHDPFMRDWMPNAGKHNIPGIANDFAAAQTPWHEHFQTQIPVIFLLGEHDRVTQRDILQQTIDNLPNATLHQLKDAAFLYPYVQPERVMEFFTNKKFY